MAIALHRFVRCDLEFVNMTLVKGHDMHLGHGQ